MAKKTARNHSTTHLQLPPGKGRFFFPASLFDIASLNKNTYLFLSLPVVFEVDVFRNFYCKSLKKRGCSLEISRKFQTFGSFLGLRQHPPIWIRDMENKHCWNLNPCVFPPRDIQQNTSMNLNAQTHTHTCHMEKCIIYGCLGTNRTNDPGFLHTGLPVIKITILEKVSTTCKQIIQ